jgi:hypothetical protein
MVAEKEQEAENLTSFEQFNDTVFHNSCHFLISGSYEVYPVSSGYFFPTYHLLGDAATSRDHFELYVSVHNDF